MDTEVLGIPRQTFNLLVIVIILVILGIVSFNAYAAWYVNAKDKVNLGFGLGANVGLDIPFLRKR